MGAEAGPFRAALTGAVGAGRGVSVGAGAGAPVWSSPQAATANIMIAAIRRATGLMRASPFSCGAGRLYLIYWRLQMEPSHSLQPYSSLEIASAVATFGTQLDSYLDYVGLPKDYILVPYERRRPVFQNIPTVLESLTEDQKSAPSYITKFVAACAVGLFDAALNYLWNETIRNLRQKVARFDRDYFFDSVVNDSNRRSKLYRGYLR